MPNTAIWRGDAKAVPQVVHATPTNVAISDVFTLTINRKDISITTTANTAADVIGKFITAITASDIPEWEEVTATDGTTYLILTGPSDGKPVTITASSVGTGNVAVATTTAATGPYHFDNAENWSTGAVPADGDTIIFENTDNDCLYGISNANTTPANIIIKQSFTGNIGLPPDNGDYIEYRDTYLTLGVSGDAQTITVRIGEGEGSGSGRIKLNTGDAATDLVMMNSGRAEGDMPAVLWKGTAATNVVRIYKGSFGTAVYGGEVSTIEDLDVGYRTSQDTDSEVVLGRGCDVYNIRVSGGSLVIGGVSADAVVSLEQTGGTVEINGTDGVDSLAVRGGRCIYNSTGTLGGAPIVSGTGILDFAQDMAAKTVTNPIEVYGDEAQVIDSFKVVTSLIVDFNETTRIESLGRNIRVTRGAPA